MYHELNSAFSRFPKKTCFIALVTHHEKHFSQEQYIICTLKHNIAICGE